MVSSCFIVKPMVLRGGVFAYEREEDGDTDRSLDVRLRLVDILFLTREAFRTARFSEVVLVAPRLSRSSIDQR